MKNKNKNEKQKSKTNFETTLSPQNTRIAGKTVFSQQTERNKHNKQKTNRNKANQIN